MSDFFLELFSEEIPSNLQKSARNQLLQSFNDFFRKENIILKKQGKTFSTPNRLVVFFDGVNSEIFQKSEEIKGPNINAPEKALSGFIKSNRIKKENLYKKNTEKGEFYYFKKPSEKIKTIDLLNKNIPIILEKVLWKKSMKWGDFDLYWGRPLKSILATFNKNKLNFKFYHIQSSNFTYLDKSSEDRTKVFKNFKSYDKYFKKNNIIIDHNLRKKVIENQVNKLLKRKILNIELDEKLLEEVTNLVESPSVLFCEFDLKYLEIPKKF